MPPTCRKVEKVAGLQIDLNWPSMCDLRKRLLNRWRQVGGRLKRRRGGTGPVFARYGIEVRCVAWGVEPQPVCTEVVHVASAAVVASCRGKQLHNHDHGNSSCATEKAYSQAVKQGLDACSVPLGAADAEQQVLTLVKVRGGDVAVAAKVREDALRGGVR